MEDLKQEYSNLNIEEPLRLLENTDSEIFLQIQKIQEEFSENKSEMKDEQNPGKEEERCGGGWAPFLWLRAGAWVGGRQTA